MQAQLNKAFYEGMNFQKFRKEIGSESKCLKRLFQTRWPEGFRCPRCNHSYYTLIEPRHLYMCKSCRRQTSLTAGTVFHKTKTPLLKWFWVIYRMATPPEADVCIADMQRDLKIKDYKTVWFMADKVRKSLCRQDPPYKLVGLFRANKSHFYTGSSDRAESSTESETVMILAISTKVGNSFGDEVPAFAQAFIAEDTSTDNIEKHLKELNFPIYDIKRLIEFTRMSSPVNTMPKPFPESMTPAARPRLLLVNQWETKPNIGTFAKPDPIPVAT